MLVHFPIALALIAAGAETLAIATRRPLWHLVGLANVRVGAFFAAGAAAAGWLFATGAGASLDGLELHRWLAVASTATMIIAALLSIPQAAQRERLRLYRAFLFVSALGIGGAAHVGATLVWGAHFFHL